MVEIVTGILKRERGFLIPSKTTQTSPGLPKTTTGGIVITSGTASPISIAALPSMPTTPSAPQQILQYPGPSQTTPTSPPVPKTTIPESGVVTDSLSTPEGIKTLSDLKSEVYQQRTQVSGAIHDIERNIIDARQAVSKYRALSPVQSMSVKQKIAYRKNVLLSPATRIGIKKQTSQFKNEIQRAIDSADSYISKANLTKAEAQKVYGDLLNKFNEYDTLEKEGYIVTGVNADGSYVLQKPIQSTSYQSQTTANPTVDKYLPDNIYGTVRDQISSKIGGSFDPTIGAEITFDDGTRVASHNFNDLIDQARRYYVDKYRSDIQQQISAQVPQPSPTIPSWKWGTGKEGVSIPSGLLPTAGQEFVEQLKGIKQIAAPQTTQVPYERKIYSVQPSTGGFFVTSRSPTKKFQIKPWEGAGGLLANLDFANYIKGMWGASQIASPFVSKEEKKKQVPQLFSAYRSGQEQAEYYKKDPWRLATSPAAITLYTLPISYGTGVGLGALTKVAPAIGTAAKVGVGTYGAYSIGKETIPVVGSFVQTGKWEEPINYAFRTGIQVPLAGYGIVRGYNLKGISKLPTKTQFGVKTLGKVETKVFNPISTGFNKIRPSNLWVKYKATKLESYIEPKVIAGKEMFPTSGGPKKTVSLFKESGYDPLTGKYKVVHATGTRGFSKTEVPFYEPSRPSDVLGTYVAPYKHASPYFLRIGKVKPTYAYTKMEFAVLPKKPSFRQFLVENIERAPPGIRTSVGRFRNWQLTTKKTSAIISAAKELGKGEAEAVINPFVKYKSTLKPSGLTQKIKGYQYYTTYKGRNIPIYEYETLGKVVKPPTILKKSSTIKPPSILKKTVDWTDRIWFKSKTYLKEKIPTKKISSREFSIRTIIPQKQVVSLKQLTERDLITQKYYGGRYIKATSPIVYAPRITSTSSVSRTEMKSSLVGKKFVSYKPSSKSYIKTTSYIPKTIRLTPQKTPSSRIQTSRGVSYTPPYYKPPTKPVYRPAPSRIPVKRPTYPRYEPPTTPIKPISSKKKPRKKIGGYRKRKFKIGSLFGGR